MTTMEELHIYNVLKNQPNNVNKKLNNNTSVFHYGIQDVLRKIRHETGNAY